MKKILLICLLFVNFSIFSQDFKSKAFEKDIVSLGFGMGQDYGGIGGFNLLVYPQQNIGFFAGIGDPLVTLSWTNGGKLKRIYGTAGAGYNIGTKIRMLVDKYGSFYIMAMYGYNAAIGVSNSPECNKLFKGASVGFGIDIGERPYKFGYWSIGVTIPLRNNNADNYINDLRINKNAYVDNLWPFSFTLGYKFIIFGK